jgi:threonine synthase
MIYRSTRNSYEAILSCGAMIKGIANDNGLYVPDEIPLINEKLEDLINMSYKELAFLIMKKFFMDFEDGELLECIEKAYDSKFDTPLIAPLVERSGVHFLELYHGPTLAFKDMALSILPHLMKTARSKLNIKRELVILTATSGDTGKAALEGFSNVDGTKIIVFYPKDGVSEIQKRQMISQEGENTFVVSIDGNFDDAQNGVKKIFGDREFGEKLYENNYILSSANSINIGRLIPQIVYYFYGYLNLLKSNKIETGEKINVVVPTGNFGNILAAYYAKGMGLPVNKLICASNINNVLYDFLNSGVYDKRRELKLTSSPSMDILISSNLERLLFEISGRDHAMIKDMMEMLQSVGSYEITNSMKKNLKDFYGGYADEHETFEGINKIYKASGYVMDTHTAVAYSVYNKYKQETGDNTKTIIVSTASPFKFGRSVCTSVGIGVDGLDDFRVIDELSRAAGIKVPGAIKALERKKVIHKNQCNKNDMKKTVEKILGV